MLCMPECYFGNPPRCRWSANPLIGVQMRKQHGVNVIDADIQLVQLTHRAASGHRPWRADEVFGMISPQ